MVGGKPALNGFEALCQQFEQMKTGSNSVQTNLDRRSAGRERCVLRCRIWHGPWSEVIDGIVRDLHEDGARLRLGSRSNMAGRIKLEIQPAGSVYVADVVWQRGDEVGVRLIATLDQTIDRQIEALRLAGAQMRSSKVRPNVDEGY